jgi:hypothetical protein
VRDAPAARRRTPGLSPDVFQAGWAAVKRQQAGADACGDAVLYRAYPMA